MKWLRLLLSYADEACEHFISPVVIDFAEVYSEQEIVAAIRRKAIKFGVVLILLLPLLFFLGRGIIKVEYALLIYSFLYLIFLMDTVFVTVKNGGLYFRLIVYRRRFIVNELSRRKPWWLDLIHQFFAYRGKLPTNEEISHAIFQYTWKKGFVLIAFGCLYIVVYRYLCWQFVVFWGCGSWSEQLYQPVIYIGQWVVS